MKVGTRMTIATSLVVALTLAIYAVLTLRDQRADRLRALQRNIEDVATALRYQVEATGTQRALANSDLGGASMSEAMTPLHISLIPGHLAQQPSPRGRLVKDLLDGHSKYRLTGNDNSIGFALPLRSSSPNRLGAYQVLGAIEVSAESQFLREAARRAARRTILIIAVIVAVVSLAVFFLIRSLVSDPIAKLLAGVDDVAHGDLSSVLLTEKEDEIGDLAARFNEMTYSLRESQSETRRHNETRASLEQKLFQTEKLATIGQIAAEIAHEVGTPLNVISGRARGISKKYSNTDVVQKNARIISEQTARITRIIQRLLDFSRRKVGQDESQIVDLNEQVLSTMEFLESKLRTADILHSMRREDSLPSMRGNPDQILQVLTNLVLNAAESMSATGGKLSIETAHATRRRPGLEVAPELPTVIVSVSDTGPGIPPEDRDKIFEPFYSSKTLEGGTGLGLAVVHGIVKAHDGWVEITDAPGGGACFSVYFPAVLAHIEADS